MHENIDPAERVSVEDHPADHICESYCHRCGFAVNPVCPNCHHCIEASGGEPDKAATYRRIMLMLRKAKNTALFIDAFFLATGDGQLYDGTSEQKISLLHGVTKGQVSKQCRYIVQQLGLIPSRSMRSEGAVEKFRSRNHRQHNT